MDERSRERQYRRRVNHAVGRVVGAARGAAVVAVRVAQLAGGVLLAAMGVLVLAFGAGEAAETAGFVAASRPAAALVERVQALDAGEEVTYRSVWVVFATEDGAARRAVLRQRAAAARD